MTSREKKTSEIEEQTSDIFRVLGYGNSYGRKQERGQLYEGKNDDIFYLPASCGGLKEEAKDSCQEGLYRSWAAVFDGISGLSCGRTAAELAADALAENETELELQKENYTQVLQELAQKLNRNIVRWRKEEKVDEMGTTMAALYPAKDAIYGMASGDSRIYRLRDGKLEQLTRDHVFQYPGHLRKVLTGYLGTEQEEDLVKVDTFRFEYQEGDQYLLCTDGVTSTVNDQGIESILQEFSYQDSVEKLLQEAIHRGSKDDRTALALKIEKRQE